MLVCPIRALRILLFLEIVKYVKHMLAGGREVRQWTRNAKFAGLFVLITYATEPFFTFVRILGDHSATRRANLTKFTRALLLT